MVKKTYAEREGSMLLQPKNRYMQDAWPGSYEQHVLVHKHIYTYKFIMITFPEKLFMSIPICVIKIYYSIA